MKPVADFEKNVLTLQRRQLISAKLQEQLLKIWEKRNDYHHLNPNIEQDRQQLQSMAGEKLKLLQAVESQIFEYRIADGKLVPSHPKYWDVNGDQVQVYLRLE